MKRVILIAALLALAAPAYPENVASGAGGTALDDTPLWVDALPATVLGLVVTGLLLVGRAFARRARRS